MEDACSDMPPHCFVLSSYAWGTASLGVGTLIDCRFLFSPGRMATLPRMVLLWNHTTRRERNSTEAYAVGPVQRKTCSRVDF